MNLPPKYNNNPTMPNTTTVITIVTTGNGISTLSVICSDMLSILLTNQRNTFIINSQAFVQSFFTRSEHIPVKTVAIAPYIATTANQNCHF